MSHTARITLNYRGIEANVVLERGWEWYADAYSVDGIDRIHVYSESFEELVKNFEKAVDGYLEDYEVWRRSFD